MDICQVQWRLTLVIWNLRSAVWYLKSLSEKRACRPQHLRLAVKVTLIIYYLYYTLFNWSFRCCNCFVSLSVSLLHCRVLKMFYFKSGEQILRQPPRKSVNCLCFHSRVWCPNLEMLALTITGLYFTVQLVCSLEIHYIHRLRKVACSHW